MQTRRLARAVTRFDILGRLGRLGRAGAGWMRETQAARPPWSTGVGRLSLSALALAVAVPLIVVGLHRSSTDATQLAICMALSGLTSVVLCAVVRWFAHRAYAESVRVQLGMPMLLTALVIALNVVLLARLMFLSSADVQLLLAFVTFGMAVALALISPLPRRLADAVGRIDLAARRLAAGEYSVRIAEDDEDTELAGVAHSLNQVAVTLQDVARQQHAAEGERTQLVRALSHELRTPISAIQAMVEAIADGVVTDPATMERYHQTLRAQTRHLALLLDELFELTRLEAGAPALRRQLVYIEELVFDAVDAMRACAEQRHLQVEVRVAQPLPALDLDPVQIHHVVTSLVQHALRHTPDGGSILVHASLIHGDGPDAEAEREAVEIQVIDSGAGIAADHLPRIFEPAYRADALRVCSPHADGAALPSSDGGLGLAIAARIVEAHGGRMCAASPLPPKARALLNALRQTGPAANAADDPGTQLSFALPTTPSHPALQQSRAAPGHAWPGHGDGN